MADTFVHVSNPPSNLLSRSGYHALRLLEAERAHDLGKRAMKRGLLGERVAPSLPTPLFDRLLPNPLGLAAGFDKNGELLARIHGYGFGFVEVGSLTLRGGPGNPKPRMFRLGDDIMNRMGLNGDPAPVVAERLRKSPTPTFAVNIAKTHDPAILGDEAIEDMLGTYRLVHDLGIYIVLNISCPNTREGKTFEEPHALAELLKAVGSARTEISRPLCVKFSPQLVDDEPKLATLLQICAAGNVDGFVACNTLPVENHYGRGGLSGSRVHPLAVRTVRFIVQQTKKPVIGVGGIFTAADAFDFLDAGATAIQAYNGFVRGPLAGPRFAFDIVAGLAERLTRDPA